MMKTISGSGPGLSETVGNWEVLTACSGSEGLAKAEAEQPDAILLDVMMPEMDGLLPSKAAD